MAREFNITAAFEWHYGERKKIDIPITNADETPADLTGKPLVWKLSRERGSPVAYMTKLSSNGGITLPVSSTARCNIEPEDYGALPRPSGLWRHELVDTSNGAVLSYGLVHLLPKMVTA